MFFSAILRNSIFTYIFGVFTRIGNFTTFSKLIAVFLSLLVRLVNNFFLLIFLFLSNFFYIFHIVLEQWIFILLLSSQFWTFLIRVYSLMSNALTEESVKWILFK